MFQIAGGSIPGSDHTMPGKPVWKNNQDAYYIYSGENFTIGIVADGCGSGKKSEVGAQLGVQLLGENIKAEVLRSLDHNAVCFDKLEKCRMNLLGRLSVVASSMGESLSEVVNDYFLFSILGFIIMPETTTVFHCGDGSYSINNDFKTIGPFPNNAPPYLAYGLLGDVETKFEVLDIPTSSIDTLMIGSDGVDYIPELKEKLQQWSQTDSLFSNPDVLRRRLAILGKEKVIDKLLVPSALKDDTTIILSRKINDS